MQRICSRIGLRLRTCEGHSTVAPPVCESRRKKINATWDFHLPRMPHLYPCQVWSDWPICKGGFDINRYATWLYKWAPVEVWHHEIYKIHPDPNCSAYGVSNSHESMHDKIGCWITSFRSATIALRAGRWVSSFMLFCMTKKSLGPNEIIESRKVRQR